MFRFTIRDVLWLMVVVGLACLLAGSFSTLRIVHLKCLALEDRVRDIEEDGQTLRIEKGMFKQELEKAIGRSIYSFSVYADPTDSEKMKYEIRSYPDEVSSGTLFLDDFAN